MRNTRLLALVLIALAALGLGGATRKSVVPPYEVVTTRNGVPIYFFKSQNVPLFEVHLLFRGGSDLDPPGHSGLALFSASMIRRGVTGLDENAISRKLDDVAGGVEVAVNEEDVTVAGFGLLEHAPVITDLLFKELSEPTFPESPFTRLKINHIDSIAQLPDSAPALASHVVAGAVFNGTTKARPGGGFKADVQRLSIKKARDFYAHLVRTDRLRVLVVGGKEKKDLLDGIVRGVEALPCERCGISESGQREWELKPFRAPRGHLLLVDRPGISEAHVRMGMMGPPRLTPEFYDLRVAETILSGNFASRLNLVIREKLNLTYGISAGFVFGRSSGSFVVSTSTRNEKIAELLGNVDRLLKGFVAGDVTEQELKMAKDYLKGSFPLGLQNIYVIANTFFSGIVTGLEPDFLDQYQKRIDAVSVRSMNAALQKHLRLEELKVVVVGPKEELGPRLKAAGYKFVVRRPAEFL